MLLQSGKHQQFRKNAWIDLLKNIFQAELLYLILEYSNMKTFYLIVVKKCIKSNSEPEPMCLLPWTHYTLK